jgi:hypothetical protein
MSETRQFQRITPSPHQKMVEWREKNRHQHFDSICLYYSHRHFNGEKKIRKFFLLILEKQIQWRWWQR